MEVYMPDELLEQIIQNTTNYVQFDTLVLYLKMW